VCPATFRSTQPRDARNPLDRTLVRLYAQPSMNRLQERFDDGVDAAALEIAIRAQSNPKVPDTAILSFVEAYGWELFEQPDGTSIWRHPAAGTRDQRVDVLAWSLAAARRRSGQRPRFCEACWRAS
jgi:hypothetical protein